MIWVVFKGMCVYVCVCVCVCVNGEVPFWIYRGGSTKTLLNSHLVIFESKRLQNDLYLLQTIILILTLLDGPEDDFWLQKLPWCHPWHWGHCVGIHTVQRCGPSWDRQNTCLLHGGCLYFLLLTPHSCVNETDVIDGNSSKCVWNLNLQQCSSSWVEPARLPWWCGITGDRSFSGLHFLLRHLHQPIKLPIPVNNLAANDEVDLLRQLVQPPERRRLPYDSKAMPRALCSGTCDSLLYCSRHWMATLPVMHHSFPVWALCACTASSYIHRYSCNWCATTHDYKTQLDYM